MNLLNRHKKPREMENLHVKATARKTPAMEYFISIMIPGTVTVLRQRKVAMTGILLQFFSNFTEQLFKGYL